MAVAAAVAAEAPKHEALQGDGDRGTAASANFSSIFDNPLMDDRGSPTRHGWPSGRGSIGPAALEDRRAAAALVEPGALPGLVLTGSNEDRAPAPASPVWRTATNPVGHNSDPVRISGSGADQLPELKKN